jgi:hypothetical protein
MAGCRRLAVGVFRSSERCLNGWLRRTTERGLAGTREVPRRALAADFVRGYAVRQSPLQAAREMRAAAPPSQQTAMAPKTATSYSASRHHRHRIGNARGAARRDQRLAACELLRLQRVRRSGRRAVVGLLQ